MEIILEDRSSIAKGTKLKAVVYVAGLLTFIDVFNS